jgi:hypothetical protein
MIFPRTLVLNYMGKQFTVVIEYAEDLETIDIMTESTVEIVSDEEGESDKDEWGEFEKLCLYGKEVLEEV